MIKRQIGLVMIVTGLLLIAIFFFDKSGLGHTMSGIGSLLMISGLFFPPKENTN